MMDVLRRNSDGRVLQFGTSIGGAAGATIIPLTAPDEVAFRAALSTPNGGVVMALPARTFTPLAVPPPDAESVAVADIQARLGVIKADATVGTTLSTNIQTLRDYLALSSPSNAQRLAMEKALIRVVAAVIRGLT